jgi:hypothetical protein
MVPGAKSFPTLEGIYYLLYIKLNYLEHKSWNTIKYAMELEDEIGFKLTHKITSACNRYKEQGGMHTYIMGSMIANIYYWIYRGFIIIGLLLYLISYNGHLGFADSNL